MDEPTSGLDSTAALNVVQTLHTMARARGRTIVLTIHQPSFRLLALIDRLLLLARGSSIYHGPTAGLGDHLRRFGRHVVAHVNQLEFALDVIEELEQSKEGIEPLVAFSRAQTEASGPLARSAAAPSALGRPRADEFATSFASQLWVLCDRGARNTLRTKELFTARLVIQCASSLVLGTLFFRIGYTPFGVQARVSYIIYVISGILFTSTQTLPVFLEERLIFVRETSRGAYRTSAFVVAQQLVYAPFFLLLAVAFCAISYFMVGMAAGTEPFLFFVFSVWLVLLVANTFVLFWGAVVPNVIRGNILVFSITAYFWLLSGFFTPQQTIPWYWIWAHYISTFKYPLEMLLENEFHAPGVTNRCFDGVNHGVVTPNCTLTPGDILRELNAGRVHKWVNTGIYVGFFCAYSFLFYLMLLRQRNQTRK